MLMASQPKEITRELFEESGRRGGKARLVKMTSEQRSRIARLAAQARWGKKAGGPDPTDPNGPGRDDQPKPGIMSTRKPCRQTGITSHQPSLFKISEPLHVRAA
jgi:hypothetical protein